MIRKLKLLKVNLKKKFSKYKIKIDEKLNNSLRTALVCLVLGFLEGLILGLIFKSLNKRVYISTSIACFIGLVVGYSNNTFGLNIAGLAAIVIQFPTVIITNFFIK